MDVIALKIPLYIDYNLKNYLISKLPDEEKKQVKAFVKEEDSLRKLFSRLFLRQYLSTLLNENNLIFLKNDYGKLFVKGHSISFNLTHSGEWLGFAFDELPIGIDIEKIKCIDDRIINVVFTSEEVEVFQSLSTKDKQEYFFSIWTLKESFIKAKGMGLYLDFKKFSLIIDQQITIKTYFQDNNNWFFKQYDIDPNYKFSVCSLNKNTPQKCKIYGINDLLKTYSLEKSF